jgi:hypothetical protein
MGQEKNAENIPFLRSTQPKSTERVPVVELSGCDLPNLQLLLDGFSWRNCDVIFADLIHIRNSVVNEVNYFNFFIRK